MFIESFYGALLTFSYFFCKEKFCVSTCVDKVTVKMLGLLSVQCFEDPGQNK